MWLTVLIVDRPGAFSDEKWTEVGGQHDQISDFVYFIVRDRIAKPGSGIIVETVQSVALRRNN